MNICEITGHRTANNPDGSTHNGRMPPHAHHVHVDPHRQEHEQRQSTEHVQQPQMVDARVTQHLLREDVLQREADGGDERTDQADHVERDLGERGNGDAGDDRHQAEVDAGRLALAQNHARQDDGEQRHGGLDWGGSGTGRQNMDYLVIYRKISKNPTIRQ